MSNQHQRPSSTRGLATLAMLKANFDRGRDHLAMFQPFVDDTIVNMQLDGATVADVQRGVAARHQLTLPPATIRTLLQRAARRHLVRRDGGRYFAGTKRDGASIDLRSLRDSIENRQAKLAEDYRSWASSRGLEIDTREAALQSLISFIERHHVRLALDGVEEHLGVTTGVDGSGQAQFMDDRIAASFLQTSIIQDSASADVLAELLEGYVLQNALLLSDVSTAERRFSNLRVFFDSTLLFGALGLQGEGDALLSGELLSLLRSEGASPEVFTATIREMQRVLAVYENKLGTPRGRKSLFPTEITRHLLTIRATPADVRTISATLERSIQDLGIRVTDAPNHIPAFTLNEASLSTALASRAGGEGETRVVHDVDCVAAVLTLRRGDSFDSLDRAKAVFVTSSQLTVRNTVKWYEDEGGSGIPPIIHFITLSNLAWLKKPAGAATLKLNELVALCGAALRPPRKVWKAFLAHLQRLENSGEVTSDEVAAIMASSLTDRLLADDDIGDDPDAASLSEVVERVKEALNEEADSRVAEAHAQISLLEQVHARRQAVIDGRARQLGTWASWAIGGVVGISFVIGTTASFVSLASGIPPAIWALVLGGVPLALAGLLSVLWGFNVRDWRARIAERISARASRWLGLETGSEDSDRRSEHTTTPSSATTNVMERPPGDGALRT